MSASRREEARIQLFSCPRDYVMHQYRAGTNYTESSFEEKDFRVLVDNK